MRKTKLLTSLAAFVLVLGLGACEGDVIINVGDVTPDESESTSQSSETEDTTEGGDGEVGEKTPAPEEGKYFLGVDVDGSTNYITGATLGSYSYEGDLTSDISRAVPVTLSSVEGNAFYLTFTLDEQTYYVTTTESEDYHNLAYQKETGLLYWNGTYGCWGDETEEYFLCYNSTYKCLYLSALEEYGPEGSKGTSSIAKLYDIPEDWQPYEEDITSIPYFEVDEIEDGGEYYFGFTYVSGGQTSYYMFNGTTDNYNDYLNCDVLKYQDPTDFVLVKTTKNQDGTYGLTFTLNETEYTIYACPNSSTKDGVTTQYGEISFIETANLTSAKSGYVTAFSYDQEHAGFTVTLSNGTWYAEAYQYNSVISLTGMESTYDWAHLYTANPEYVVPERPEITLEGDAYKLGVYDSTNTTYRYFNGSTTGSTFLDTTTEWDEAADVYINGIDDDEISNSCTLAFINSDYEIKYVTGSSSTSITLGDNPYTWVWDEENQGFSTHGLEKDRIISFYQGTSGGSPTYTFRAYESPASSYNHAVAYATEPTESGSTEDDVPEGLIGTYDFTIVGKTSDNTNANETQIKEHIDASWVAGNTTVNPLESISNVSKINIGGAGNSNIATNHDVLKFGNKDNGGSITLTLTTDVKCAVVYATTWTDTACTLTINSVSNSVTQNPNNLTDVSEVDPYLYTFADATTTLAFSTSARALIFSIELYSIDITLDV